MCIEILCKIEKKKVLTNGIFVDHLQKVFNIVILWKKWFLILKLAEVYQLSSINKCFLIEKH